MEVPEIASGTVEIKEIAREAGSRTKIAVMSHQAGVDPIGACVGQRGTRVLTVINELNGEKIDVIEWSEDPERFIANSLAPAQVSEVNLLDRMNAKVTVPEDQMSLAIGREGQNVRLAVKLTKWKIEIEGAEEFQEQMAAEAAAAEEEEGAAPETTDEAEEKPEAVAEEETVEAAEEETPEEETADEEAAAEGEEDDAAAKKAAADAAASSGEEE
jgi:N utilization substance protein A